MLKYGKSAQKGIGEHQEQIGVDGDLFRNSGCTVGVSYVMGRYGLGEGFHGEKVARMSTNTFQEKGESWVALGHTAEMGICSSHFMVVLSS